MSVETPEFMAMLRRLLRAAGRRVAAADEHELVELVELVALRDTLEAVITEAIEGQRAAGRSWADIGRALGITRQSAHERYGRHT